MICNDRAGTIVVLAVGALALAACGSSTQPATTPAPSQSAAASSSSTPIPSTLSEGETVELTAELLAVPGYSYVDVSSSERTAELAQLPKDVSAAAFHGVTDTKTGKEIGFLVVMVPAPTDAMHAPSNSRAFGQWALGTTAVTEQDFSGQQVWATEDLSRPESRYLYAWLRHGTAGSLDGPDRATLEQFLTGYFAVPFRGAEDPRLAERMVSLPGYAFTNAVDQAQLKSDAQDLFPGSTASSHYVFDPTHMFGGLLLVGPIQQMPDTEIVATVGKWYAKGYAPQTASDLQRQADFTAGTVTVHHLVNPSTGLHLYIWCWSDTGVVGWLVTSRPDIGQGFVKAFVTAQPATVTG